MAELARADELVRTIDSDPAFRSEVEAAPTMDAKRQVLDARGFQDVTLDDMKAYVESKGGQIIIKPGGQELSDQELAAVAGGLTSEEETAVNVVGGVVGVGVLVGVAAIAAG